MPPSPMLHEATLSYLKTRKNLLAFSGGGDSTALFFLLLEQGIPFDIALVNYQTRPQSDEEEAYAKTLAARYKKQAYTFTCKLSAKNFEHTARLKRYTFFEELIGKNGYQTLLSAHHLGDKLEWFLMQMSKGAGLIEMLGMREIEELENYTLVRPLLHVSKSQLQAYLHNNSITFFEDASNEDMTYLRNTFRHHYATPLIEAYEAGLAKSFTYLEEDAKRLLPLEATRIKELYILPLHEDNLVVIRSIDKVLKRLGKVASTAQKEEILRTRDCVIGGKIAVCFSKESIFIAPSTRCVMDKPFKERCRTLGIPAKIRPYLYTMEISPSALRLNRIP